MKNLPSRTNKGFFEPGYLSSVIKQDLIF